MPFSDFFYKVLAICVFVFNFFDALITQHLVDSGLGKELNPFVDYVLVNFPGTMIPLKVIVGALFVILSLRCVSLKIAKIGILITFSVYFALMVYYAVCFFLGAFGDVL